MIAINDGTNTKLYHAYHAYSTSVDYPERMALACGVLRDGNKIASPACLRYYGKTPIFTYVVANDRLLIQPNPDDIGSRWCFGELDTTYDASNRNYWKTYSGGTPVKGFMPEQVVGGNSANIFIDPEPYSSGSSFNFWHEEVQPYTGIAASLGSWGTFLQSPVNGGDTRIKRVMYNANYPDYLTLTSVNLDITIPNSVNLLFRVNLMINLDIRLFEESDFYPGSSNFDISLAGGFSTRTGDAWELVNEGTYYPVPNQSSGYIPVSMHTTKYKISGAGTVANPTTTELLLRGEYGLRYPAGSGYNPLRIPFPGFRIGPYSLLQAPKRQYIVRGYAMTIEAALE